MNTAKYLMTFTLFPLLFLARGCSEDSEEFYEENNEFMEVHYNENDKVTKAMAIESWETFLKNSQDLIDITEINISSLETKIDEADATEKTALQEVCNSSNITLLKLKADRIRCNKEFSVAITDYDTSDSSVQQKNEAFMKRFKHELFEVNDALENLLEKTKS